MSEVIFKSTNPDTYGSADRTVVQLLGSDIFTVGGWSLCGDMAVYNLDDIEKC